MADAPSGSRDAAGLPGPSLPKPVLSAGPRLPLSEDGAHQSPEEEDAALVSPQPCPVKTAQLLRAPGWAARVLSDCGHGVALARMSHPLPSLTPRRVKTRRAGRTRAPGVQGSRTRGTSPGSSSQHGPHLQPGRAGGQPRKGPAQHEKGQQSQTWQPLRPRHPLGPGKVLSCPGVHSGLPGRSHTCTRPAGAGKRPSMRLKPTIPCGRCSQSQSLVIVRLSPWPLCGAAL